QTNTAINSSKESTQETQDTSIEEEEEEEDKSLNTSRRKGRKKGSKKTQEENDLSFSLRAVLKTLGQGRVWREAVSKSKWNTTEIQEWSSSHVVNDMKNNMSIREIEDRVNLTMNNHRNHLSTLAKKKRGTEVSTTFKKTKSLPANFNLKTGYKVYVVHRAYVRAKKVGKALVLESTDDMYKLYLNSQYDTKTLIELPKHQENLVANFHQLKLGNIFWIKKCDTSPVTQKKPTTKPTIPR
uniref:Uncharacterized protein n=2 Tax=Clytia hemisphaerica TaxID=252671 RepID=A0A7M5XHL3_9CNID